MTPEEAKTSGRGDRDVTESASGLDAVVRQMPTWEERCGEYRTENHGKEICCKERQRKKGSRGVGARRRFCFGMVRGSRACFMSFENEREKLKMQERGDKCGCDIL